MIKLKIIHSPDLMACDEYEFFKNTISIGNSSSDINIEDSLIYSHHMNIEVTEDQRIIIEPASSVKSYFLDGKTTTTKSYISSGQEITIGETKILILSSEYQKHIDIKSLRDQSLKSLASNNSKKLDLLSKVQKLLT